MYDSRLCLEIRQKSGTSDAGQGKKKRGQMRRCKASAASLCIEGRSEGGSFLSAQATLPMPSTHDQERPIPGGQIPAKSLQVLVSGR